MRRSSPSSRTDSRLGRAAAVLCLARLAAAGSALVFPGALCPVLLASARADARPPFQVVTRDGHVYATAREPAIKNGYLFLSDELKNFLSVPLQTIDWEATRAANLALPPNLLDHWEEGPVRYLLSAEQVKEYRALTGDPERAAWISSFWSAIDPTPETFFNEKRLEYWKRVQGANAQFTDSTKPGWKTDRGKVYILLGPPDEIESFPSRSGNDARYDPRYSSDAPEGYTRQTIPPRGVVRWLYRNPPGGQLDPNTLIAFREDPTGEYFLSTEGIDYDRIFRDVTAQVVNPANLSNRLALGTIGIPFTRVEAASGLGRSGTPAVSALSLMGDLGKIQDLALVQNWISEVVNAREFFGAFPVHSECHFYRSQEGQTYAEVNLELDESEARRPAGPGGKPAAGRKSAGKPGESPFEISARLLSQRDPSQVIEFGAKGGFAVVADPGSPEGRWIFQTGAGVVPGLYTLLIGIVRPATGEIGSWREIVEVPDLSGGGLVLSDVELASRVESHPEHEGGAYKEPFLQGHLRVVPSVGHAYRSGSELAFYFQIYGAESDPTTGKPTLDLTYRFEAKEAEGMRPVSEPVKLQAQSELSQAFSFPLAKWPPGAYRLTVEVTDRKSGQRATRSAEFSVTAE